MNFYKLYMPITSIYKLIMNFYELYMPVTSIYTLLRLV
jgi:hypothetical protein